MLVAAAGGWSTLLGGEVGRCVGDAAGCSSNVLRAMSSSVAARSADADAGQRGGPERGERPPAIAIYLMLVSRFLVCITAQRAGRLDCLWRVVVYAAVLAHLSVAKEVLVNPGWVTNMPTGGGKPSGTHVTVRIKFPFTPFFSGASVAFGARQDRQRYMSQRWETSKLQLFETYIRPSLSLHGGRCGSRDVARQLLVARGGPNHPGRREPRGSQVGTSGVAPALEDGPIHSQPLAAH